MTTREFCQHDPKYARMTWVISAGLQDSGPICEACMSQLWNDLGKYPDARDTVSILGLEIVEKDDAE